MDIEIGLAIGLVVGLIIGYLLVRAFLQKGNQVKIEEMNAKADLEIKEARLTAKRLVDDAETKADKLLSTAESKHERIKQKKIQEAKDRFNKLRGDFESSKAEHIVKMKEREMEVKSLENELKQKQDKFQDQKKQIDLLRQDVEQKEADVKVIRENLDKQLKILAKKRDELDAANEQRIKALEKIANLSEQEAKEQILEAVKAKSETDAMAIVN